MSSPPAALIWFPPQCWPGQHSLHQQGWLSPWCDPPDHQDHCHHHSLGHCHRHCHCDCHRRDKLGCYSMWLLCNKFSRWQSHMNHFNRTTHHCEKALVVLPEHQMEHITDLNLTKKKIHLTRSPECNHPSSSNASTVFSLEALTSCWDISCKIIKEQLLWHCAFGLSEDDGGASH